MSKKLIAVASAAALALTALVGVAPASATAATITYTAGTGGAGTTGSPYAAPVPHTNTIEAANTLKIDVANLLIGDKVTVTISGSAKVVDDTAGTASSLVNVGNLGAGSLTDTRTSNGTTTLYVFGTKVEASTVTVSVTETETTGVTSTQSSTVVYKPSVGPVYKITNLVTPSTLALGATADVTFNQTDAFGNVIEASSSAASVAVDSPNTVAAGGVATWDSTRKLNVARVTSGVLPSKPFIITLDANGSTTDPTNIGLGTVSMTATAVVNSAANVSQVTALTAQITALTADYNALAKKWNARVASKTAPKKKVALK